MTRRASLLIILAAALLIIPLLSCRKAAVSDYAYAALPLTAVTDARRANMLEGASLGQVAPELGIVAAWLEPAEERPTARS